MNHCTAPILRLAVIRSHFKNDTERLDKLPGPQTHRWYAAKAIEHNWSRNIAAMQIETRLVERSGKAVTNCKPACPASNRLNANWVTTVHLKKKKKTIPNDLPSNPGL